MYFEVKYKPTIPVKPEIDKVVIALSAKEAKDLEIIINYAKVYMHSLHPEWNKELILWLNENLKKC